MNASLEADVAIVGAGPAGAACALLLARAGFDVLLLDRQQFPRAKPCGDCLSPQANIVLERLGVLTHVLAASHARLAGWRITGPERASFSERFASVCGSGTRLDSAIAIERARFDAILLEHAIRAGARFLAPCHVTGLHAQPHAVLLETRARSSRWLRARLAIGADGLRSVIARRIDAVARPPRIRSKFSLTAHMELPPPPPDDTLGEMHVADGLCAGIAPVTQTDPAVWNVTIVADSIRFGRAAAADPKRFFMAALSTFPSLRHRFDTSTLDSSTFHASTLLASGPFDRPTRRVVADRVALVGDAAGYFDPFTGQGIYQAIACAERLADVAARALAAGETNAAALREYARAHAQMVRPAHRMQRFLDAVLRRPGLADFAIARLGRRPVAARAILAATGDVRPPASLLSVRPLLSFAGPRWIERLF